MKLVIVESPKKCDTIGRYLGKDYKVMASQGHIRDLATTGKGGLGIDIEKDFKPNYVVSNAKKRIVNELKTAKHKSDEVILATDPDREGEAIAWHLTQVLDLDPKATKRLEFHEITQPSIVAAIDNPGKIDMNLVQSQETRRILDRIIGFKLSGLMQKKINSRSAGRVQSATLKILCDHEKEIKAFKPEEYWSIDALLSKDNGNVEADFHKVNGETIKITSEKECDEVLKKIGKTAKVAEVKKTIRKVESKPPFSTSTLQQEAYNRFKFSTKKTSIIAQRLYEGIDLGSEHVGLVTYIRTDSTRLAPNYVERAIEYISETFGKEYIGSVRQNKLQANAQDAHEAIRPTSNHRTPESIRHFLTPDSYKLYKLIYDRAVSSLMSAKKEEVTVVIFDSNGVSFKSEGVRVIFDGYTRIYGEFEDKTIKYLPEINEKDELKIEKINHEQHFTQAPARYSEAKIVKVMEEKGIGRPSTYASTISTLLERKYVTSEGGVLFPTEQGMKTAHVLSKFFPTLVDSKYTANMETELDGVQDGSESRTTMIKDFYYPFIELVNEANKTMYKDPDEQTGEVCPLCGSPLVIKKSKFGKFTACSNYPQCKFIKKEIKAKATETGEMCPKCGKPLVERKDKKGKIFVACSGYPDCKYIKGQDETKKVVDESQYVKSCPKCNGHLVVKKGKISDFLGCTNFPKCRYMEKIVSEKK